MSRRGTTGYRVARDGLPYSWAEFRDWYGVTSVAWSVWEQSTPVVGLAAQPTGEAHDASGAVQPSVQSSILEESAPCASGVAQPAVEAHGVSSAVQPAVQQSAPEESAPLARGVAQPAVEAHGASAVVQPAVEEPVLEESAPLTSGAAQPSVEAPGTTAVFQPVDQNATLQLALLPVITPWNPMEWEVFQPVLPQRIHWMRDLTPRAAINRAYELYDYLPLRVETFTDPQHVLLQCMNMGQLDLNLLEVLGFTAERIPRILDTNRTGYNRVDFFLYLSDGSVLRFHPGRTLSSWLKPRRMLLDMR